MHDYLKYDGKVKQCFQQRKTESPLQDFKNFAWNIRDNDSGPDKKVYQS